MKLSIKTRLLHALAGAIFVVMPMHQAQSAPGTLPKAPLFLSTIVEPNVFMTLDDSYSMASRTLVPNDPTKVKSSLISVDDNNIAIMKFDIYLIQLFYLNPNIDDASDGYTDFIVPPADLYSEAWILRSHSSNYTYYNPDVVYDVWPGDDPSGNPYKEYHDTTGGKLVVPMDPNDATGTSVDLLANHAYNDRNGKSTKTYYIPTYYKWNEEGTDTVIDTATSTFTEVKITAADTTQIQNFSNWYVYHRTRELAMKAALGKFVNNTDSFRMGMRLFNGGHKIDSATMSDPTNKANLLKQLYSIESFSALNVTTPTRRALESTGLMFEGLDPDGVPSPILPEVDGGTCQQNFNILMTDGYWNGPLPTWNTKQPKDGDNTDIDSTVAVSEFDGGSYADNHSNTLADVGMHFYENDLSVLANEVPARAGIDENTQQHLVNYVLSFGLTGTLDTSLDPANYTLPASDPNYFPGWTNPADGNAEKVDDLWHTAYNSRGELISINGGTSDLESAMSRALSDISEVTGTITASVAVNSARLSTESIVYLARFFSDTWWGDVAAYPIIDTNTGELAASPSWNAVKELDNRTAPRIISTFDAATRKGISFDWSSISLNTDMAADLNMGPTGVADGLGPQRLDFIRGDATYEGTTFRDRTIQSGEFKGMQARLGDIANSSPVFVGPPNLAWPDREPFPTAAPYSDFKVLKENRKDLLYVGANDGMLHAFDAETGREEFAYIPGLVYSADAKLGLHYLTDPNYIHNFYVDLPPTVSDVYISSGASKQWHTVLIGGLRGGGRGFFALDVTTPETYSALSPKPDTLSLWELSSTDHPDFAELGYTFARPTIALTNAGTWVAIFGNGYNSTGTGQASLFIVDIEKGTDGTWDTGDFQIIETGAGTPTAQNGLSAPALADIDGNGTVDRVYAGDLEGNMWIFDLSGTNSGNWGLAKFTGGGMDGKLFTTAAKQPITAKPVLASHPTVANSVQNDPNIMVYFGTGQYLVSGDKITKDVQSFYGVWDHGSSSMTQSNLVQQTFDTSFSGRVLTRNPVDYATHDGWFFNLPDSGERSVTSPIARADTVFFNTFVPGDDPCDRGGYGWRFAVDMDTGGSPEHATIDSNNDGVIDDADLQHNGTGDTSTLAAVRQEGFLPEPVFIEDLAFTGDQGAKIKALSKVPTGRFSWQELIF